jgi:serine/threonine-protein phosphatase 2B regulatory subunit
MSIFGMMMSCCFPVIFKVYDSDGNGRVAMNDMLEVLRDLTGQFISEQQREVSCY